MPLTPRSHDWQKDTPDEHRLEALRNAAFLVVDWILSNPAEGVFGWVPHATAFKSMDELCSYIDKVITFLRVHLRLHHKSPSLIHLRS